MSRRAQWASLAALVACAGSEPESGPTGSEPPVEQPCDCPSDTSQLDTATPPTDPTTESRSYTFTAEPTLDVSRANGDGNHADTYLLPDGGFVAVWQEGHLGEAIGFMQLFDRDGTPRLANDFQLATTAVGHADVLVHDETIIVTYDNQGSGVFGRRFNLQGEEIGRETLLFDEGDSIDHSELAPLTDGRGYVFIGATNGEFQAHGSAGNGRYWLMELDAELERHFDPLMFAASPAGAGAIDVASTPDGGYVMTWLSRTYNPFDEFEVLSGVEARIYRADGSVIGLQVDEVTGPPTTRSMLASNEDGYTAIAWSTGRKPEASGTFARFFDSEGRPLTDQFLVGPDSGRASVAMAGHVVIVAWQSTPASAPAENWASVYDVRTGEELSEPIPLTTPDPQFADRPMVEATLMDDGSVVVHTVWELVDNFGFSRVHARYHVLTEQPR